MLVLLLVILMESPKAATSDAVAEAAEIIVEKQSKIREKENALAETEEMLATVDKGEIVPGKTATEKAVAEWDTESKKWTFGSVTARYETKKRLKMLIPKRKKELDVERASPVEFPTMSPFLPKKGQWGVLRPRTGYHVLQVLDKGSLLLTGNDVTLIVSGVSTENVPDGAPVEMIAPFECLGTKMYRTVLGGSNTVFELRRIDVDKANEIAKKKLATQKK